MKFSDVPKTLNASQKSPQDVNMSSTGSGSGSGSGTGYKRQLIVINRDANYCKTTCLLEPADKKLKSTINDPITSNISRNVNSISDSNVDNVSESKPNLCSSISNQCRKKLFFALMIVLILLICVNLLLTLWILKVLEFSINGMNNLKILPNGIKVDGQAIILGSLIASKIKSRSKHPLTLESSGNFSINIRNQNGHLIHRFFIGDNQFNCTTDTFRVINRQGKVIFAVSEDETILRSDNVQITNTAGVKVHKSIQTPLIRSQSKNDLRFESITRSLRLDAAETIEMKSSVGNLDLQSYKDINLRSQNSRIVIDANDIRFNNFLKSFSSDTNEASNLCLCPNGKLVTSSLTCKLSNLQLCN